MTRNIFTVINSAMNWNSMVSLTPRCVDEIFGRSILFMLTACLCGLLSVSPRGLFTLMPLFQPAVASITLDGKVFHQNWSDFKRSQSSTFRELLAVLLSLQAFIDFLHAQTV